MKEVLTDNWIFILNDSAKENKKRVTLESQKDYNGTLGKYLFFSTEQETLIKLAKKILKEYKLYHAKVARYLTYPRTQYVLCIYDYKNIHSEKLKKFETAKVNYANWKSDKQTIKERK